MVCMTLSVHEHSTSDASEKICEMLFRCEDLSALC
jgi:hypothetical protein